MSSQNTASPKVILEQDPGDLLTAEGGVLKTPLALREKLAIFSSGLCLLIKTHADDSDVVSHIALAKRLGYPVLPPQFVDLGSVKSAYIKELEKKQQKQIVVLSGMKKELMELLRQAGEYRASDVHLVVDKSETNVFFRIDGDRKPMLERPWPAEYGHQMCRTAYAIADIADASYEQFAYQAARMSSDMPTGLQAARLQFNPVGFDGRQLVIRLLYAQQGNAASLQDLGFSDYHLPILQRLRGEAVGVIIVSGPTGSGKSTTLERMLRYMVAEYPGDHILSVEDPPEYIIPGVVQLPVANAKNDDEREDAFTEAIAAAMRSDPDRIMIGEVRTRASADLAIRAALTGHAVYTTLHSNDAMGIISRLIDIGVKPFMIKDPSVMKGLIAQRLIGKLCQHCSPEVSLGDLPGDMGERIAPYLDNNFVRVKGDGCDKCRGGYAGRTVIAEIILPDDTLLTLLAEGQRTEAEIYWRDVLRGRGLKDHALEKIRKGIIDPIDIERKVGRY
ncbi:MAG: GspE/PulE family protein [Alphaproteobacteria bacterium]